MAMAASSFSSGYPSAQQDRQGPRAAVSRGGRVASAPVHGSAPTQLEKRLADISAHMKRQFQEEKAELERRQQAELERVEEELRSELQEVHRVSSDRLDRVQELEETLKQKEEEISQMRLARTRTEAELNSKGSNEKLESFKSAVQRLLETHPTRGMHYFLGPPADDDSDCHEQGFEGSDDQGIVIGVLSRSDPSSFQLYAGGFKNCIGTGADCCYMVTDEKGVKWAAKRYKLPKGELQVEVLLAFTFTGPPPQKLVNTLEKCLKEALGYNKVQSQIELFKLTQAANSSRAAARAVTVTLKIVFAKEEGQYLSKYACFADLNGKVRQLGQSVAPTNSKHPANVLKEVAATYGVQIESIAVVPSGLETTGKALCPCCDSPMLTNRNAKDEPHVDASKDCIMCRVRGILYNCSSRNCRFQACKECQEGGKRVAQIYSELLTWRSKATQRVPGIVHYERVIETNLSIFVLMKFLEKESPLESLKQVQEAEGRGERAISMEGGCDLCDLLLGDPGSAYPGFVNTEDFRTQQPEIYDQIVEIKSCWSTHYPMVFKQLVEAVHLLHQKQIYHMDLKPENIWLKGNWFRGHGQTLLLDFGTACFGADARAGWPGFADDPPPTYGGPTASVATDMFRLGTTLYRMITGSRPWEHPACRGQALHDFLSVLTGAYRYDYYDDQGGFVNTSSYIDVLDMYSEWSDIPAEVQETIAMLVSKDPAARGTTDSLLSGSWLSSISAGAPLPPPSEPVL